ncbi:hypothetical protein ACFC1I_05185 [Microbacterium sp. NPDC056044]|uniref:hypothetical protein n=1 Tax=Microbacterium sp. NPDC056044 TaxID=3345690 RepID=UPI0035DA61B9
MGWPDLAGALWLIAAGLLIVAGLIGLAVWDARRRRSPAVVLDVASAIARLWVAFAGVGAILAVWRQFSGDVWVADVPVVVDVPGLSCEGAEAPVTATAPTLVCGSVSSVDLTVAGLDIGMRMLLAVGDLLAIVVVATPGLLLAIACSQTLKGAPFSRVVGRWLLIGALVVLVAGLGSELLSSLGRTVISHELFPDHGADVVSTGIYRVGVSFWPIGAAFALAALGAIFRHGERLQRETAGLV